jgi:hypothetical protein
MSYAYRGNRQGIHLDHVDENLQLAKRSSEVAGTRSLLKDSLRGGDPMRTKEQRLAIRTHRGWAISVLQEAHAIHECEYHGWAKDRADPHARDYAEAIARQHPPAGLSPDAAVT